MSKFKLSVDKVTKSFTRKVNIFENISFDLLPGDIVGITGPNGSGKSTLLKIIVGSMQASSGKVEFQKDGKVIEPGEFNSYFGYVAPYLNLYEEFTPLEHNEIFSKIRNIPKNEDYFKENLEKFNLIKHRNKPIRNFSSGMKQRMKYLTAVISNPDILFLDEPTSNLDEAGSTILLDDVKRRAEAGCGIIMASNEVREIALCNSKISIV